MTSGGIRIGATASFQLVAQQLCTGGQIHHGKMHRRKRKEKTTPFRVNSMRSSVYYRAAEGQDAYN